MDSPAAIPRSSNSLDQFCAQGLSQKQVILTDVGVDPGVMWIVCNVDWHDLT